MKKLIFQVANGKFVSYDCGSYGRGKTNVGTFHGIAPQEFVRIYENIAGTYNLSITEEFLFNFTEELTAFGKKQEMLIGVVGQLIDFMLDIESLREKKVNVEALVNDFKKSKDIYVLRHVFSLAFLSSVYASKRYTVEFPSRSTGRNPDLSINGTTADLKVIQQSDLGAIHVKKGRTFETKLTEDLCYDIGQSIRDRLHDGMKQAELIFIDLGAKSLSMRWFGDEHSTSRRIVPKPKKYRVVYFCKQRAVRRKVSRSFFATYVDIDPKLWDFIKNTDSTVTHRMI